MKLLFMLLCNIAFIPVFAQQNPAAAPSNQEEMKKEILMLRQDVDNIQMNLGTSQNKFKRGIGIATLGYSITIAGGLMLGRENDDLGKVLLVSGGVLGITGTVLMVDAFKYLGRASRKQR